MSGWKRGKPSYNHQHADRLRDKLLSKRENDGEEGQSDRLRHPPGLRGRAIGMWYQQNRRARTEPTEKTLLAGPNVSLSYERIKKIRDSVRLEQTNSVNQSNATSFKNDFQSHNRQDFLELLKSRLSSAVEWEDKESDERLFEELKSKSASDDYKKMQVIRQNLPAYNHKDEILEAIEMHQVVLIEGNTGCGKTTQVVQYILDSAMETLKGSKTRILCTQPRRIAAMSIAERVAAERDEPLGQSTGYQIRLEKVPPRYSGSVLFCTTGVLMKFMESDPSLRSYSHIVIDEIHERNVTTDVCLGLVKQIVEHRKDLKVILMSATLNAESFSRFFNNCPMIHIEGFTYPVQDVYIEDVLEETGFDNFKEQRKAPVWVKHLDKNKKKANEFDVVVGNYVRSLTGRYSSKTINTLLNPETESINVNFIEHLIHHISYSKSEGAILVILPGFTVISKIFESLQNSPHFPSSKFIIYPLHSMLTGNDQRNIFKRPPEGVRKIILSTPLAETSITIEDVVYVINAGKMRKPYMDFERNALVLEDQWITKANETQRKGRAGRVQTGICYHLYTRARSDSLEAFEEPEILRIRLEEIILTIKVLCIKNVKDFMTKMIDVPQDHVIETSIQLLQRLGALSEAEELTPLGLHLARLAVPPQVGKMLLLGSILGCFDPVASIAAGLSFKTPFYTVMGNEENANKAKWQFSKDSDQLAVAYAMNAWTNVSQSQQRSFCYKNFLSHTTMLMLDRMKSQFAQALHSFQFLHEPRCDHVANNQNSNNENTLRAVICGGLYPNIAYRFTKYTKNYQKDLIKTFDRKGLSLLPSSVNGDKSTVYDRGFMMFHELQKFTSGFFLLETTASVSPYAILMFGDRIKSQSIEGVNCISVGDIVQFKCDPETAQLIIELRDGFNRLLEQKVLAPSPIAWNEGEGKLVQAILDLISVGSNTFKDYDGNLSDDNE